MPHTSRVLQFCLLLLPIHALAGTSLDGVWEVTFSTRYTETRQAQVKINGTQGTWTTVAQGGKEKNDPCVGHPFPLMVKNTETASVVLEVSFSKIVPGCKDRTITGRLTETNSIEGKLENGKPVRMLRK